MIGLGLLAGLIFGLGIVALIALMTGRWQPTTGGVRSSGAVRWARRVWRGPYRTATARRNHQRRLFAAGAAVLLVWLVTGMPAFALMVAVAIPGLPWLLGAGRIEEDAIARLEAIQAWTRRLRDLVGMGTGLQQAIITSVATAPAEVATEVADLAVRLRAGYAPALALHRFADDLDDGNADEVIAALLEHMAASGDGLEEVLTGIADSTAEQVANRREVHAERANGRLTLKILTIAAVAVLGAGPLMGEYARPFTTPAGQAILLAAVSVLIGLLLLGRQVNMPRKTVRFLATAQNATGATDSAPAGTARAGRKPALEGAS